MNINSVSSLNTNINQNNTCKKLRINPNFTSVTPAKIFKDGVLVTDEKTFRKTIRAFFKELTQYRYKVGDAKDSIISKFKEVDKQFNLNFDDNGKILREYVNKKDYVSNGTFHFFTGGHAEKLDELGRKIGLVKAGYSQASLSDIKKDYFNKVKAFLTYEGARLGKSYDDAKSAYNDEKVGMHILVKEVPINKRNSKLVIDDIKFRNIIEN